MVNFKGKRALVGGIGQGPGEAMGKRLSDDAATVIVLDLIAETAEKCAAEINKSGVCVLALNTAWNKSNEVLRLCF